MFDYTAVRVGRVTVGDITGIWNVYRQCWVRTYPSKSHGITLEDTYDWLSKRQTPQRYAELVQRLRNPSTKLVWMVAKDGDRVIGVCRAVRKERVNLIESLYVLPEYQGKGVGKKLFYETYRLLDVAKQTVVLCAEYNAQSIKFYQKLGFSITKKGIRNERFKMKSGNIIPEVEMFLPSRPAS